MDEARPVPTLDWLARSQSRRRTRIVGVLLLYLVTVFQTYMDYRHWFWEAVLFELSLERAALLAALLYQVVRLATNENVRGRSIVLWSQTNKDEVRIVVAAVILTLGSTEFLGYYRSATFLLALGAIVLPWKKTVIHPRSRKVVVWRWFPRSLSYDRLDGLTTHVKTYQPSSEDFSRTVVHAHFIALQPREGNPILIGPADDETLWVPGRSPCETLHRLTDLPLVCRA